jgi:hypothetical protein
MGRLFHQKSVFRTAACFAAFASSGFAQGDLDAPLNALIHVGREGEGNEAASAAVTRLSAAGPSALLPILKAAGRGSSVADNWLRVTATTIVDGARRAKTALPVSEIKGFIRDTKQNESARILAFEILSEADSSEAHGLENELLHDPVQSLRRGAVSKLIASAAAAEGTKAKQLWTEALTAVRDEDQTKTVVAALKKHGVEVNIPRHFGFLTHWSVVGPFDNAERKGFDTVFPPETGVDLKKVYEGKGKSIRWESFHSDDEYGKVDLNKPLTALKESTAYAVTSFVSEGERDVELRLGCKNAWKVWLNGTLLFSRDEYHRGQKMDQYTLKGRLKKGPNSVLVKCCQNEQTESWTVEWEFQLRVCDSAGTGLNFEPLKP